MDLILNFLIAFNIFYLSFPLCHSRVPKQSFQVNGPNWRGDMVYDVDITIARQFNQFSAMCVQVSILL